MFRKEGPLEFWIPTGDLPSGQGADLPSDPQRSSIEGTWTSSSSQLEGSGAAPLAYQLLRCEAARFCCPFVERRKGWVSFSIRYREVAHAHKRGSGFSSRPVGTTGQG